MAERRTRRRFTAEFKAQAAGRVPEGGKPLSDVAAERSPNAMRAAWYEETLRREA